MRADGAESVETMSLFLSEVAQRHPREFIVMVMDQAGWHIAGELAVPPNMRLFFLPPYSPELNPAEHLWKSLREDCFANHVFASLDAVESALTKGIVALESDPLQIRLMTGFKWILYTFEHYLVSDSDQSAVGWHAFDPSARSRET